MICLTGDIHNMSLGTSEQVYLDGKYTEVELGMTYLEIAQRCNLKVTFFVTGKSVLEEAKRIRRMTEFQNLELGGHTYNAFRPSLFYFIFDKVFRLRNGPKFYQKMNITRTINALGKITKTQVVSWRDHAYRYDKNTFNLLKEIGLKCVSDIVSPNLLMPQRIDYGLVSVPINTMPDHEHIYHGPRTEEVVYNYIARTNWTDNFTFKSYNIRQWCQIVKEQVQQIVDKKNGIATILAHPICMKVSDDFQTFEKLCDFLSSYPSIFVKEATSLIAEEDNRLAKER